VVQIATCFTPIVGQMFDTALYLVFEAHGVRKGVAGPIAFFRHVA